MSSSVMKRAAALVLAFVVLGVLGAGQAAASPAGAAVSAKGGTERSATLEDEILRALNQVRAANGLRPLKPSDALHSAAAGHSAALLGAGVFQHESPDGTAFDARIRRDYSTRGFSSWSVGENLLSTTSTLSAAEAVRLWMNSPPHRRNILAPEWRDAGIGAVYTASATGAFGARTAWVVTLDFGVRTGGSATISGRARDGAQTTKRLPADATRRP